MALDFTQSANNIVTREVLNHTIGVIDSTYLRKADKPGFKIAKLGTPEEGFASSYKLVTDSGADVPDSATINLAKDMMLQDVDILICDTTDKPETGYAVGDKYFDFMVYTAASAAEGASGVKHLYLKVSEFIDAYKSGNAAINVTADNKISLVVDTTNANGLEVGTQGLKMNLASASSNGAMSSSDKSKLDTIHENASAVEVPATADGSITVNGEKKTVYQHPTTTAVAAGMKKVGSDDKGHVVVEDMTKKDVTDLVGACSTTEGDVGLLTAAEKTAIAGAIQSTDVTAVTISDVNAMFAAVGVNVPATPES